MKPPTRAEEPHTKADSVTQFDDFSYGTKKAVAIAFPR
jgi:hypothetical protein